MIRDGKYIPETHTGTPEEIILGLMREAADIIRSGLMRQFAKDRELCRIQAALEERGIVLLEGRQSDTGYLLGMEAGKPHAEECSLDEGGLCYCEPKYRVKIG